MAYAPKPRANWSLYLMNADRGVRGRQETRTWKINDRDDIVSILKDILNADCTEVRCWDSVVLIGFVGNHCDSTDVGSCLLTSVLLDNQVHARQRYLHVLSIIYLANVTFEVIFNGKCRKSLSWRRLSEDDTSHPPPSYGLLYKFFIVASVF